MNEKILIELIIERAMVAFGAKTQRQLAEMFNILPVDFSNRKRRGSITKLIEKEAFKYGKDWNWIKTGEGSPSRIAEQQAPYSPQPIQENYDLINKTAAILNSRTIYHSALRSNIEAFHHALVCEEKLEIANKRIDDLEIRLKTVENRLLAAEAL